MYLLGLADIVYKLNFVESFAFGSLISAVDPVATLAIFQGNSSHGNQGFLAMFRIRIRFFYGYGSRFFPNTDPDPGITKAITKILGEIFVFNPKSKYFIFVFNQSSRYLFY